MPWLICRDLETALDSLASAIGVSVDDLSYMLHNYDETRLDASSEDPFRQMPREILEELGAEGVRFDGVHYFHGTRVKDPDEFRRRGILPLNEMIEPVWRDLYELVREEVSPEQWIAFRRSVESGACDDAIYVGRLEAKYKSGYGPDGVLVREVLLNPDAASSQDFLNCPELVQDIARCFLNMHRIALEDRFRSTSYACIVTFRTTSVWPGAFPTAVWYAFSKLRDGELGTNAAGGYGGEGTPVPPQDVVEVEVIDRRHS